MADVRLALYSKLVSLSFFDIAGGLISRVTSDVSLLQNKFSVTLAEFFRQIGTFLIGILIIRFIAPILTRFMLATFPVLIMLAVIFGRYIRQLSRQTQDQLASANVIVEETLPAIQAVKSFTIKLIEKRKYNESFTKVITTALRSAVFRSLFISFVILVLFGGIVAVTWYGASLVKAGTITVGELISLFYTQLLSEELAVPTNLQ